MAGKGHRVTVKLKSTESPYIYSVKKNKQNTTERLELKKYDPVVRKHVVFKESRYRTRRARQRPFRCADTTRQAHSGRRVFFFETNESRGRSAEC